MEAMTHRPSGADTGAVPGIAATADDQIVCEKILRLCTHRYWIDLHEEPDHYLGCPECRARFAFSSAHAARARPTLSPREFLDRTIPKPSLDEALAERVLSLLEDAGFTSSLHLHSGSCVVSVSGHGGSFRSLKRETQAAAICDVAAQVCRSGIIG
jgi:hypothetical protein